MNCPQPLSLVGVGHHLAAAFERHHDNDSKYLAAAPDSSDKHAAEVGMRWSLTEIMAWQGLAMAHRPRTLADATTQLGILFDFIGDISASDLAEQLKEGTLETDLETVKRVVAGLTVMVARVAEFDLTTIGEPDLWAGLSAYA